MKAYAMNINLLEQETIIMSDTWGIFEYIPLIWWDSKALQLLCDPSQSFEVE